MRRNRTLNRPGRNSTSFQMQIEFSNVVEEFKKNTQCTCQQTPCLQGSSYKGFMSKPYMEVSLTMAAIREQYWIPTLRQLVKSVLSACWGCKRFIASPLTVPPPGLLPTDRTDGGAAFEVIGTDFTGPIKYKQRKRSEEMSASKVSWKIPTSPGNLTQAELLGGEDNCSG